MLKSIREYLDMIEDEIQRERVTELISWISIKYNNLNLEVKWNQPMFIDHGTYIIGLSVSKKHLAIGLEAKSMERLKTIIEASDYSYSKMLIKILWNQTIDYDFLEKIISDIIADKKDVNSFWY